jgi:hypothetical protein
MNINDEGYQYKSTGASFNPGHQHVRAGCFYCLKTFDVSDIKEYTDKGKTAICPHCHIDSVVGDCGGELPPKEVFKKWYNESFGF